MRLWKNISIASAILLVGCSHTEPPMSTRESTPSVPRITLVPYPDDMVDEFDPGFQKWILNIGSLQPSESIVYDIERKFSLIEPSEQKEKSGTTLEGKQGVVTIVLSGRGFIPGEEITFLFKKDGALEYKKLSFCPRPIVVSDSEGRTLIKAVLASVEPVTQYYLNCSFNPKNRLVCFQSFSGNEHISEPLFQSEPMTIVSIPDVINQKGGVASLEFTYQDGQVYTLEFPWGQELIPYLLGDK